jgi:hypothetical protein
MENLDWGVTLFLSNLFRFKQTVCLISEDRLVPTYREVPMADSDKGYEFLLGAYDALKSDIIRWIPEVNRRALEWDMVQLKRLAVNRGQRYLTIDLPEFGKAFEASLCSGHLPPTSVPGFGRNRCVKGRLDRRPRLFWALLSRVFTCRSNLKTDPCALSILFIRQLCYLFKKLKGDCSEKYKFTTIKEFFEVEKQLVGPTLDWEDPIATFHGNPRLLVDFCDLSHRGKLQTGPPDGEPLVSIQHLGALQRVCDTLIGRVTPDVDIQSLQGRHGPGSVSDAGLQADKYLFPTWPDKLQSLFPYDWHVSSNLMVDGHTPHNGPVFSKLICVPKTHKAPRLIASEPTCNQWIQQAVAKVVLESLERWEIPQSVDIKNQSLNQEKARLASLGHLATIDLNSASDRLSCHTVERVFRGNPSLLACFMACRTPLLVNTVDKKFPSEILLKKFAMMGSALTFPVQTFTFLCLAISSVLYVRKLPIKLSTISKVLSEIGVYGDDIIVPVDSAQALVNLMDDLGLKVNTSKSFWTGLFRESCGADWYNGANVTPCYIRADFDPTKPGTAWSVIEVSNNLYKAGLWELCSYVTNRVPRRLLLRLPIEDGSIALKGLFSFMGVRLYHLKSRWSSEYHRTEYRVAQLLGIIGTKAPEGIARLRRYFTEIPGPDIVWNPRIYEREVPVLRERYAPLYGGALSP